MSTPLPHPVEPAYSEAAAPLAVALVHRAIRLAHDTAPATPAAIAARDQAQAAIAELPPGPGRDLLGLTCDVLDALGRYHDARAIAHAIMELRPPSPRLQTPRSGHLPPRCRPAPLATRYLPA